MKLEYAARRMSTWQLYVDETGDFSSATRDLVVAGVLVKGYGTRQLDDVLRGKLDEIFVGVPYPAHAAHHNLRSSLLWGPLRNLAVEGPFAERFRVATEAGVAIVRSSHAEEVVAFQAAVELASTPKEINYAVLTAFDRWLHREHHGAHMSLSHEGDRQRGDLATFLQRDLATALPEHGVALIAASQARGLIDEAPSVAAANMRYVALYESLLERAAAFVAERDEDSRLWIHLAGRNVLDHSQVRRLNTAEANARSHPLLARARSRPVVVRTKDRPYDENVPPGIVLADFAANSFGRTLRQLSSWQQVTTSIQWAIGINPEARCGILTFPSPLPAVEANGEARMAVRLASEGKPAPVPQQPLWARDQALLWIRALEAEAQR
jgi:hypothetical protein